MIITPYTKNAKKHPKKQVEQVANSIKEFGMNQPIVVDKQGVIIVGHGRYEALKSLGWEIKDEYIKVVDLTDEQANAYRLADNKLNESEWEMSLVIDELKGLSNEMLDLTGFEKDLIINPDDLGTDFSLPRGEKSDFEQITFTLHSEQASVIKNIINDIKKTDVYKYQETYGNENSNGNALYALANTYKEKYE